MREKVCVCGGGLQEEGASLCSGQVRESRGKFQVNKVVVVGGMALRLLFPSGLVVVATVASKSREQVNTREPDLLLINDHAA